MYVGPVEADASPMEPGIFLIPAGAVEKAPPPEWGDDVWPRWNGAEWVLVRKPRQNRPEQIADPLAKLRIFLAENPDVASLISNEI